MKKISTLERGTVFTYAKERFVVLEAMDDGVLCILEQSKKSVPFNSKSNGDAAPNDYRSSTLREEIEGPWLEGLLDNGGNLEDMVRFDVDLRPTDQSEGYGTIQAYAAPLTLWQYGKYKDIIPLNEDDWWWLVTPWACPWLRSPDTSVSAYAWRVNSNGYANHSSCTSTFGIRPALKLNSNLLVSIDGEEEEDEDDPKKEVLQTIATHVLVREVERRLSIIKDCIENGKAGDQETGNYEF